MDGVAAWQPRSRTSPLDPESEAKAAVAKFQSSRFAFRARLARLDALEGWTAKQVENPASEQSAFKDIDHSEACEHYAQEEFRLSEEYEAAACAFLQEAQDRAAADVAVGAWTFQPSEKTSLLEVSFAEEREARSRAAAWMQEHQAEREAHLHAENKLARALEEIAILQVESLKAQEIAAGAYSSMQWHAEPRQADSVRSGLSLVTDESAALHKGQSQMESHQPEKVVAPRPGKRESGFASNGDEVKLTLQDDGSLHQLDTKELNSLQVSTTGPGPGFAVDAPVLLQSSSSIEDTPGPEGMVKDSPRQQSTPSQGTSQAQGMVRESPRQQSMPIQERLMVDSMLRGSPMQQRTPSKDNSSAEGIVRDAPTQQSTPRQETPRQQNMPSQNTSSTAGVVRNLPKQQSMPIPARLPVERSIEDSPRVQSMPSQEKSVAEGMLKDSPSHQTVPSQENRDSSRQQSMPSAPSTQARVSQSGAGNASKRTARSHRQYHSDPARPYSQHHSIRKETSSESVSTSPQGILRARSATLSEDHPKNTSLSPQRARTETSLYHSSKSEGEASPRARQGIVSAEETGASLSRGIMEALKLPASDVCRRQPNGAFPELAFKECRVLEFSAGGLEFEFEVVAPEIFRDLRRNAYGVQDDEFCRSMCLHALTGGQQGEGRSGMLFFFSWDKRFLAKTVKADEVSFFFESLDVYHKHFRGADAGFTSTGSTASLLPRFSGFYGLKFAREAKTYLIVFENIFPANVKLKEKYDLKGVLGKNRFVTEEQRAQGVEVLKDRNFAARALNVGPEMKKRLMTQIRRDVCFLEEQGKLDYSLLLGVADKQVLVDAIHEDPDQQWPSLECHGVCSVNSDGSAGKEVFFFGIIDILQAYTSKKAMENRLKSVKHGLVHALKRSDHADAWNAVSSVPPGHYARRFLDYLDQKTE